MGDLSRVTQSNGYGSWEEERINPVSHPLSPFLCPPQRTIQEGASILLGIRKHIIVRIVIGLYQSTKTRATHYMMLYRFVRAQGVCGDGEQGDTEGGVR